MRDEIEVGQAPCEEECAQVGTPGYRDQAIAECKAYIEAIRNCVGREPEGARLAYKGFPHDYGTYYEVVVYYDTDVPEARDYAYMVESQAPTTWEEGRVEKPTPARGGKRSR